MSQCKETLPLARAGEHSQNGDTNAFEPKKDFRHELYDWLQREVLRFRYAAAGEGTRLIAWCWTAVHPRLFSMPKRGDPIGRLLNMHSASPMPRKLRDSSGLRWVEGHDGGLYPLRHAGVSGNVSRRRAIFSNVSEVFADYCAQHVRG